MPKRPSVVTCARFSAASKSLSLDAEGHAYVLAGDGQVYKCSLGEMSLIELGAVFETLVPERQRLGLEVAPDGRTLFVCTSKNGIWMLGTDDGSRPIALVPNDEAQDPPCAMVCTGPTLYFLAIDIMDVCKLYSVDLERKEVTELPTEQRVAAGPLPSLAINPARNLAYIIYPKYPDAVVHQVHLPTPSNTNNSRSNNSNQPQGQGQGQGPPPAQARLLEHSFELSLRAAFGPEELTDSVFVRDCLADGSLLMSISGRLARYWPPGVAGAGPDGRLVVVCGAREAAGADCAGNKAPHLQKPADAAVDGRGRIWACDSAGASAGSSLRCVNTALPPSSRLLPSPSEAWTLGGSASNGRGPSRSSSSGATSLALGWEQLLDSGTGSDVALVAGDGTQVHAHKLVLMAQSDLFKQLLGGEGLPAAAEVPVKELSGPVLKAAVRYAYTGRVRLWDLQQEADTAAAAKEGGSKPKRQRTGEAGAGGSGPPYQLLAQLLRAASFLQMPQLHAACLELARARIDAQCAIPWLIYGEEHGERELQQLALPYAAMHYAEIKADYPEGLMQLQAHPKLLFLMMDAAVTAAASPGADGA